MGRILNIGNDVFKEFSKIPYFVDKSEIINKLLRKNADEKFICNSRARRFGKSVTADMLAAYFSRGIDSRELFAPMKCEKDELFLESMNNYDTIFVDIQAEFVKAKMMGLEPNLQLNKSIVSELSDVYSDIVAGNEALGDALAKIFIKTGGQFVIIFDECDYPIRELDINDPDRKAYVEFLRSLFKNNAAKSYLRLAYLTGIMPIVRTKGQSAVNNFREYTMADPKDLAQCIGFTEDEVGELCLKFNVDFEQMKAWYNGYNMCGHAIYNPLSVVRALEGGKFKQYWSVTGSYGDIEDLIRHGFDGLRDAIIKMLAGSRIPIDVDDGINDLQTFETKEQVLTALIHLGYLAYDEKTEEAYIPNREIEEVFYKAVKRSKNDGLAGFIKHSGKILDAVLEGDEEKAAALIQGIHQDFISSIEYNNENSLACTITIAMLAAFSYYQRPIREFPCGKGFADIVYLPQPAYSAYPVIVVELKWDKSADTAISQIKNRQYPQSLKGCSGNILLVGTSYDKKTKEHRCRIEMLEE